MLLRRSSRIAADASHCLRAAIASSSSRGHLDGDGTARLMSTNVSQPAHDNRGRSSRNPLSGATGLFGAHVQQLGFATNAVEEIGHSPIATALKNPSNEITYDEHVHERFPPGDPSKRAFAYFVLTGGRFVYASTLRLAVLKFVLSMSATRDVLALASLEVDLGKINLGQTVTVKWRGKPVFIRRRSESDIALANEVNLSELRDPEPDSVRAQNPEWLVVVGVCTHLGCVPLPNSGDYGGWFCPCHGSHYDISGRIRKGPAPSNLEVPTYKFLDEGKLLIG